MTQTPEFSVIVSCFNEESTVAEFLKRLDRTLLSLGRTYEIVATDDGSMDNTYVVLKQEMESIQSLTSIVKLFKNSGQAAGLTASIERASGRHFIFVDSDLQFAPEELPKLIAKFDLGVDVVTGYRKNRRDSWTRRLLSLAANHIMRRAGDVGVRDFGCNFKVLRGELVRACNLGPMRVVRMTQVLSLATRIEEIEVKHFARAAGSSGWSFESLLSLLVDNLIGTSVLVFQRIAFVAIFVSALLALRVLSAVFFDVVIIQEITHGLLLNIAFIWGLVTVGLLALVGEFARQIYQLLGGRPAYVIKEITTRVYK